MQSIFSVKINNPIRVTEHLFQPQKRSCCCHSKSCITTVGQSVLFKGAASLLLFFECFCPDTHLHDQNTNCAHHKIIFFYSQTGKTRLFTPYKLYCFVCPRWCPLLNKTEALWRHPDQSFLEKAGFVLFSCKCCSCIVVITILDFKVILLDGTVFHCSISVFSDRFYWPTRRNLSVIKLNGQNSVWNKQVDTTCLCSEGSCFFFIWLTLDSFVFCNFSQQCPQH